jgi:polyhydroxyalkanoate synthase
MHQAWMGMAANLPQGLPGTESPRAAAIQAEYAARQLELWRAMLSGAQPESVVRPESGDRRFASREWRDNPYYDYLKQSYLLAAKYLVELADAAPLEGQAKERLRFATRQWVDAMSPANFAATNPDALRAAVDTQGESLARGLANLLADAKKGHISQTDESAFEVGRNLAVTPGQVVYENDLMQLIQYAPTTAEVGLRPLVMVPPCINKFYILDLQPENSFVRYAVGEGHTVFMVNALGFCVGGTLLGAALAVMAAKGDRSVASATYLTTMLDFHETGQIGLFVDESSVRQREASLGAGGILPGADLATVFSSLRANDLVWPYVVNNYLKGGSPAAFDLLYWNADSTNLPGPMYCWYLRNTYLENKLCVPGAVKNCGADVDLGKAAMPAFIVATREDHIVPWRSAYRSLAHLGGEKQFVLGASGHIAGVINPASKGKRSYWSDGPAGVADAEAWLAAATEHRGSWWPRWSQWLEGFKGGTRAAPEATGSAAYPPIEAAPGRYVKERATASPAH